MSEQKYDVIVVGAGAAGLIAAGRAAHLGAKVLVIDKKRKAGTKLLITGKGRCNITHDADEMIYFNNIYPNPKFLRHAFKTFFKDDVIKIMTEQGVETTTERGQRVFPVSNNAADVVDALTRWVGNERVDYLFRARVLELLTDASGVSGVKVLVDDREKTILAPKVIICTGGKSYPATGSTGDGYLFAQQVGHTVVLPQPALVPLVTAGPLASQLQGLALKNVKAMVWADGKKVAEEFGELMFAHYGLTGPIILTLSRRVVALLNENKKVQISIDLKPALDEKKLDNRLIRDLNEFGKRQIENLFRLWLPSKLIPVFLDLLKLDAKSPAHQFTSEKRKQTLRLLKHFAFDIEGHPGFKEAIVTSGGIALNEVVSKTMESKKVRNLYFAGEVLDLDANTGGFNLQIAFSTGYLAAGSAVSSLK